MRYARDSIGRFAPTGGGVSGRSMAGRRKVRAQNASARRVVARTKIGAVVNGPSGKFTVTAKWGANPGGRGMLMQYSGGGAVGAVSAISAARHNPGIAARSNTAKTKSVRLGS